MPYPDRMLLLGVCAHQLRFSDIHALELLVQEILKLVDDPHFFLFAHGHILLELVGELGNLVPDIPVVSNLLVRVKRLESLAAVPLVQIGRAHV